MINPAQMQKMMKQLGITSKELDASEVLIKTSSGTLVVRNPQVVEMKVQGKLMFQVVGEVEELPYNDEDVELVMEQASVDREEAIKLLREAEGDVAQAIMLKNKE